MSPKSSFSSESDAQNEFRRRLHEIGCLTEKLHGGMYQNGLPDLLVGVGVHKTLHLVEMKLLKTNTRHTTVASIIELLRSGKQGSRQLAVCAEWGGSGFPVWIVVATHDCTWACVRMQRPKREWLSSTVEWGPVEAVLMRLIQPNPNSAAGTDPR